MFVEVNVEELRRAERKPPLVWPVDSRSNLHRPAHPVTVSIREGNGETELGENFGFRVVRQLEMVRKYLQERTHQHDNAQHERQQSYSDGAERFRQAACHQDTAANSEKD